MRPPPMSPRINEVRKGVTWRVLDFFYKLLEGDHEWAERRLFLLILMGAAFMLMSRATEQIAPFEFLAPTLAEMPEALRFVVSFLASLAHPQTLRHILPPLVGSYLAIRLASNYVRDLFEIADPPPPAITCRRRSLAGITPRSRSAAMAMKRTMRKTRIRFQKLAVRDSSTSARATWRSSSESAVPLR